jgi:hypothetical protein
MSSNPKRDWWGFSAAMVATCVCALFAYALQFSHSPDPSLAGAFMAISVCWFVAGVCVFFKGAK